MRFKLWLGGILFYFGSMRKLRPCKNQDHCHGKILPEFSVQPRLFHSNAHHPFTVRAYPRWSVADAPFILLKTFGANLKTARTVPAERFFLTAAAATILAESSFSITFLLFCSHGMRASFNQRAYGSSISMICVAISSGTS